MKRTVMMLPMMLTLTLVLLLLLALIVSVPALCMKATLPIAENSSEPGTTVSMRALTAAAVSIDVAKQTKSKPSYLVHVDLLKQQIHVYKKTQGKNTLIRTMPCATGRKHTPTPKGLFKMKQVGKFVYDKKYNCYLKYAIRFHGSYLLHSVPVNRKGRILDATIGKPASHGCIRLLIEDSKWLYQLPANTAVLIE